MWHGRSEGSELREEREGVDVLGLHDGEVSVVERCDLGLLVSLSECNETGIGAAERKTVVAGDELGCALPIIDGEMFHDDVAGNDAVVEKSLDVRSEFSLDEVVIALTEIPQVCSSNFPTCEVWSS